jgi:hypothetical protein
MKINEVIGEGIFSAKPKVSPEFFQAFVAWQQNGSTQSVEQAATVILNDPLSAPYRKPAAGVTTLYRTVGDINKSPTARNRVAVAYATSRGGAEAFFRNIRSDHDFHVVQKKLIPQDFLLDFKAMCQGLGLTNSQYQKENEVWMRPTEYYRSYKADELIDRRAWYQKMMNKGQHPAVQAKAVRAATEKELDELL